MAQESQSISRAAKLGLGRVGETSHPADELGRNLRGASGIRRDENQDLLYAHAQLAMMGRFDANLAGGAAGFDRPQVESKTIAESGGLGEIDGKMHRGRQDLLVVK